MFFDGLSVEAFVDIRGTEQTTYSLDFAQR